MRLGRDDVLTVPERSVVLHIGPHKTGTTAIQGALHNARPSLVDHGVVYAGQERQHRRAALALTGGKGLWGEPAYDRKDWTRLVREVRSEPDRRVIVSSEAFAEASDDVARSVVEDLDTGRVHIVVTLRPLAKLLASSWQQFVRNRLKLSYEEWLDAILNHPDSTTVTPSFWQRHRHDVLVDRWTSIVGPGRVAVVVVDDSDRTFLMRAFEQLVGLPADLLAEDVDWTNRSLTAAEIELIRLINVDWDKLKWSADLYHQAIRQGVVRHMQRRTPQSSEAQITTPDWAVERANDIAAAAADRIVARGVRIVGDPSILSAVSPPNHDQSLAGARLPLPAVTIALIQTIKTAIDATPEWPPAKAPVRADTKVKRRKPAKRRNPKRRNPKRGEADGP